MFSAVSKPFPGLSLPKSGELVQVLSVDCGRRHLDLLCCKSPDLRVNLAINSPLAMSRKYKIRDQDKLYFVTFTVIKWLDPPVADTVFLSEEESVKTFFSKA